MSLIGVAGEDRNDFTKAESAQIRRRSLRLLLDVLRPYRGRFVATIVLVVISTALQVAGPALIAAGIDRGLPAVTDDGNFTPLIMIVEIGRAHV